MDSALFILSEVWFYLATAKVGFCNFSTEHCIQVSEKEAPKAGGCACEDRGRLEKVRSVQKKITDIFKRFEYKF